MMLTFRYLTSWERAIAVATMLHEHDGFPSRATRVPEKADGCAAPCCLCVDTGWALECSGEWICTAPVLFAPADYGDEVCPARVPHSHTVLSAQVSHEAHGPTITDDVETLEVLRWMRRTLTCIAASDHASATLASGFLSGADFATDLPSLEALGSEILRRKDLTCPCLCR